MKHCAAPLALLSLLLGTAVSPLAAEPVVRGLVLDSARRPVSGARVELFPFLGLYEQGLQRLEGRAPGAVASAATDELGRFTIRSEKTGVFQLRVSATGKVPLAFDPLLLAAETELPPALLSEDEGAAFRLRTAEGKPAGDLWVLAEGLCEEPALGGWRIAPRVARSSLGGAVILPRLSAEELRLRVFGPGGWENLHDPATPGELRIGATAGGIRSVRVVDEKGEPVAGALVRSGEASWPAGLTDEEGRLRLSSVPSGTPLRLRVAAADGRTVFQQLQQAEETIVLPDLRPLGGRVLREEDGKPLAGALIWSPLDPGSSATSDPEGRYRTLAPQTGGVWLEVRAAGRLPKRVLLDPRRSGVGRAPTVTLARAGELTGRVTDAAGKPIAGVSLRSFPLGRDGEPMPLDPSVPLPSASTGLDGTFRLGDLKAGEAALLQAVKAGFLPVRLESRVPAANERREPVLLVLPPARAAGGRVVDELKQPVSGARVHLSPALPGGKGGKDELLSGRGATGPDSAPKAFSDGSGRFTIAEIPSLDLDVVVTKPGFAPTVLRHFRAAPASASAAPAASLLGSQPGPTTSGTGPVQLGDLVLRPGVALRGLVTDAAGKPVAGARVYRVAEVRPPQEQLASLREKTAQATTGGDGRFQIADLRRGEPVHLLVAATGYLPLSVRGVLPPPPTPLQVTLTPGNELVGRVFDPEGRPVAGAALSLSSRATLPGRKDIQVGVPVTRSAASDRQGRFHFTEMPAGRARLAVAVAGYQPIEEVAVALPQGPGEEVKVILERGATVEGKVTNTAGDAVSGVRILTGFASGISDEAGAFQINGARPGLLAVEAVHPQYPRFRQRLRVEPGNNHLDVVLKTGTTVRGRVVDGKGTPLTGAFARLESVERNEARSFAARSEGGGEVTFRAVATGTYRLVASARGYAESEAASRVIVGTEPVEGVEVQLPASATLSGRILGLAPDELASVTLTLRHEEGRSIQGEIDAAGGYLFPDLAAGAWFLEATLLEGERSAHARVVLAEGGKETRDLRFGEGYSLAGRILYRGEPLADARVSLRGQALAVERSATTSYDGAFRFADLDADSYWLGVSQTTEQLAHNEIVTLSADRELLIDLQRQTVAGRVTEAEGGKPVDGAAVALRHVAGAEGPEFMIADGTTPSGTFAVERVPPGHYRLTVNRGGYAPDEREIDVPAGQDLSGIEVRLQPTQGAELAVRCASGFPPNLLHLRVVSPTGAALLAESRPVDGGGRVRLTTVPAGQWTLLAASARCGLATTPLAVPNESGAPLSLVLPAASRLVVRVPALQTSDAIARLTVRGSDGRALQTLEMGGSLKAEWPLVAGSATLGAVPAGSWTLSVQAPDGRSWTASVATDGQEEAQVSLE